MSLTFGVNNSGFVMPSYDAYNSYVEQNLQTSIPNIDLASGSVTSTMTSIFANAGYQMLECLENLYYQLFPETANGVNLDRLCAFVGLTRIKATYTTALIVFTGVNGTYIPSGTIVQDVNNQFQFTNSTAFTLSSNNCYSAKMGVQIQSGQSYDISVNGIYIGLQYTSLSTTASIISQIQTNFNANGLNSSLIFKTIDNTSFSIQTNDINISFALSFNSQIFSINSISVAQSFSSMTIGQIYVNANVLNQLSSPASGITSVNNPLDAMPGSNTETDIQLRRRFFNIGRYSRSYATSFAIIASFQDTNLIQEISYINLIQNRSNSTDSNNLPPHSICLVVLGGNNTSIANLLWKVAPAGIGFYGNTSVTITDSLGNPQVVSFTRPTSVYIYVKVTLTPQAGMTISNTNQQDIINAIMNYGNSLKPGQNVITAVLSAHALIAADSILDNISVQIGTSLASNIAPASYASTDATISITQIATFNESYITFV